MSLSIRPASDADFPEIARLDGAAFGMTYSATDLSDALLVVEPDRFFVAVLDDQIVGVTGDYPFTMSVPGGEVAVPGVTWVSVSPVHRRRGILRAMMEHQLSSFAARGETLSILTASEAGTYRRFGYGQATQARKTTIDRRLATLDRPGQQEPVEYATAERARELIPAIHERWRCERAGALSRTERRWNRLFVDREANRAGLTALQFLIHADGYVSYRVREKWVDGQPQFDCVIVDYIWTTAAAHRALWQVLLGLDLVGVIESQQIPLDDPLPQLLNNPRLLRTNTVNDGIWVRLIDVCAALSARSYGVEVDVTLEVVDASLGGAALPASESLGRFRLRGGPEGGECSRTDKPAQIRLTIDALGSSYLGGLRLSALQAADRVWTTDDQLLRRVDRALLADTAPFHGTDF